MNLNEKKWCESIQNSENSKILDVRTPEEFDSGFIKESINLNIYDSHLFLEGVKNFSKSDFHKSSKFLGKGDFMSQTRISDIQENLWTPGWPHRDLGVLSFDLPSSSPQFHVFGGHVTFRPKPIIQKI